MGTFFRKSLFITISVFSSNSFGYCIDFLSIFNLFLYKVRGTDLVYSSIFGYLLFLAPYAEGAFFSIVCGCRDNLQRYTFSDVFSSTGLHFLNFLPSPKIYHHLGTEFSAH